jgi:hypothetical protein
MVGPHGVAGLEDRLFSHSEDDTNELRSVPESIATAQQPPLSENKILQGKAERPRLTALFQ